MSSFPNFGRSSSYDRVAAVEIMEEEELGEFALGHFEIGRIGDDDGIDHDLEQADPPGKNHLAPKHQEGPVSVILTSTSTASHPLYSTRPPSNYYCPLTLHLMEDPVADGCGHCFERDAISSWVKNHLFCPISRKPLEEKDFIAVTALRERIQHWQELHRSRDDPSSSSPCCEPNLLLALSDTDSHSPFELMLLPQERNVLAIVKLRRQDRTQREACVRCTWTVVTIVTLCFMIVSFVVIYNFHVELQGPL